MLSIDPDSDAVIQAALFAYYEGPPHGGGSYGPVEVQAFRWALKAAALQTTKEGN